MSAIGAEEHSKLDGESVQRSRASALRDVLREVAGRRPILKRALLYAQARLGLLEHTVAQVAPDVIRPRPRRLTVAITAHCNLRCIGCRYGRDFMPGAQLPLDTVKELLADAKGCGIELIRLYGGEPLLHPDLPAMIRYAVGLGLSVYVTTNGILLKQKIDLLYSAGLRNLTIGFYGTEGAYNDYVQRTEAFRRLNDGVAAVRTRCGSSVSMQLNFLLMRPSCSVESLHKAWSFAKQYDMTFHTDLIHYSLPYFTEGPDRELQFTEADRGVIGEVVGELVRLKQSEPHRITDTLAGIRSIPDWLLKGPAMRVPCDAHKLIWVGADGTVQLCYVTFRLGNLHERPLRELMFTAAHRKAAKDAFLLNCPNCHCEREARIQKHLPSLYKYGA
jgi:MoaA/NifB/PqqE/SkfB family radical SAM enzyme